MGGLRFSTPPKIFVSAPVGRGYLVLACSGGGGVGDRDTPQHILFFSSGGVKLWDGGVQPPQPSATIAVALH